MSRKPCKPCGKQAEIEGDYHAVNPAQVGLYRELWRQLHAYARLVEEWSASEAEAWFKRWEHQIPRRCECRRHWQEVKQQLPPDLNSREAFYTWTVAAHNLVNERLGKPQWVPI